MRPERLAIKRHVVVQVDSLLCAVWSAHDDVVRRNRDNLPAFCRLDRPQFLAYRVFVGLLVILCVSGLYERGFGVHEGQCLREHAGSHDYALPFDHCLKRHHVREAGKCAVHVRHAVLCFGFRYILHFAVHKGRHHGQVTLLLPRKREWGVGQFLRSLVFLLACSEVYDGRIDLSVFAFHSAAGKTHVYAHLARLRGP